MGLLVSSKAPDRMVANSVDLSVMRQYRAKQVAMLLGVCNEQVPPTEVKMCSDLHGDMQRLAEMTSPSV